MGRFVVLTYHRVLEAADPFRPHEPTVARFRAHMAVVRRWFRPLTLAAACAAAQQRRLPARAVVVTFDDGYRDNHDLALPVLREFGIPATVFVATGFIGGTPMWNDRVIEALRHTRHAALKADDLGLDLRLDSVAARVAAVGPVLERLKYLAPEARLREVERLERLLATGPTDDLMMDAERIRALADAGIEVGGHTVSHPILATLDAAAAGAEIIDGKRHLEALLDREVVSFAYPNGRPGRDFNEGNVAQVGAAGFRQAVTTRYATARSDGDRLQIPRTTQSERSHPRMLARMVRNFFEG